MSLFLTRARSTELYRRLCAVPGTEDGNLLERTDDSLAEAQVEFLRWVLQSAVPSTVLETGTNKGLFGYLLSLIGKPLKLRTFDLDPRAAQAVDILNNGQSVVKAEFRAGDTRKTLAELQEPADFAWIDGGHASDIPMSDLLNCYRLRVPWIAVDDSVYPGVAAAIEYMLGHTPYESVENPYATNDRRKAVLLRLQQ